MRPLKSPLRRHLWVRFSKARRRPVALLLLAGSDRPCGICGTLASGGHVNGETSDSVETNMTVRQNV